MYHLHSNQSISAIMPAMVQSEYIYKLILSSINILIQLINNYGVQIIKYD
jgi:hypothetical protein